MLRLRAGEKFRAEFGYEPATVVHAPGRVNLIGEHTDYSLLPVLPMACDRHVAAAASPRADGLLTMVSVGWPGRVAAPATTERSGWARYVSAAVKAIGGGPAGGGADIAIAADLPAEGGLSSSSALTVAVLEALNRVWDCGLSPDRLVDAAVSAERSIGIEGGRMDQTVIVHAEADRALRIEFAPQRMQKVPLPEGLRIVVAHSGEIAAKTDAIRDEYDARVIGCRLASDLIGSWLGNDLPDRPALGHVAGFNGVETMIRRLPERLTARGAAEALGTAPLRYCRLRSRRWPADRPVPVRVCAMHVLAEASRVDEACAALAGADLAAFGSILDASHRSLIALGVSTQRLDELAAVMRGAGAFGARLTGAGFGGFAVAAVPVAAVADVVAAAAASHGGPAFETRAADGLR